MGFLAQKWPIWAQMCFIGHFRPMAFLVHLMPRPTKKTMPRIWFSDMWVPELLLPPKIIRMLAQKRPFLPQKTPIYFIWNILYTTYIILLIINGSHSEWENSNLDHLHNADQSRHTAERIRAEVEFVYSRPRGKSINPQKNLNLGFLVWAETFKCRQTSWLQRGAASHFSNSRRFLDFVLILLVLARNQNLFVFAQNQNLYLLAQNQNLFVLAQNQNLLVFIQIQNMFVLAQNQNLFVLAQKWEKVSDKTNSIHGHTLNSRGFLHFFRHYKAVILFSFKKWLYLLQRGRRSIRNWVGGGQNQIFNLFQ